MKRGTLTLTLTLTWHDDDGNGVYVLSDGIGTAWGMGESPLTAFRDWCEAVAQDLHFPLNELGGPLLAEMRAWRQAFGEEFDVTPPSGSP